MVGSSKAGSHTLNCRSFGRDNRHIKQRLNTLDLAVIAPEHRILLESNELIMTSCLLDL